jgi:hypothetical protein
VSFDLREFFRYLQDDAIALDQHLGNSEVLIVPGANHFFSRPGQFEPVCEKIASWLSSVNSMPKLESTG